MVDGGADEGIDGIGTHRAHRCGAVAADQFFQFFLDAVSPAAGRAAVRLRVLERVPEPGTAPRYRRRYHRIGDNHIG